MFASESTAAVDPPPLSANERTNKNGRFHHTISFEEIVKGRDATVRVTDDGLLYAIDLVMVVTGHSRDDSGKVLRRLTETIFHSTKNLSERQLSTRGGPKTKLISFKDALELVMVLPGKVAKETRTQFASIIRRYMAGDSSLVGEIQANGQSTSPIAELARLNSSSSSDPCDEVAMEASINKKRKYEELEICNMEISIKTKQLNNIKLEVEIQALLQANQATRVNTHVTIMDKYAEISTSLSIDERARLMFKDTLLNLSSQIVTPTLMIANTTNTSSSNSNNTADNPQQTTATKPTSISLVASELGYRLTSKQLIAVGKDVKKRYMARHNGDAPPKHDQLCDGRVTKVNSYMECDKDLIAESLRDCYPPNHDD